MSEDVKSVDEKNEMKELLEDYLADVQANTVVKGRVVKVEDDQLIVGITGYKKDLILPKKEWSFPEPETLRGLAEVDDEIDVYVVSLGGGDNEGIVSRTRVEQMHAWDEMQEVYDRHEMVEAQVTQVVKGGLVVSVNGLRGFIPASQMELHFVKDLSVYVGQTVTAEIIELDTTRGNKNRLVLSRRRLLEEERDKKQEEVFSTLEAGQTVRGTVKRLVDYGAFIDIGGVDGLAHISDLSWERVKQPSDVLTVGQELDVYVKAVDTETKRISLSIKDTMRDPWLDKAEKYAEGDYIEGKVIKLTDFGAFMEIEPGFDGLIPMGELCEKRIERADEAVHTGDMVRVKVLRIDMKRKRISLSITRAKKDEQAGQAEEQTAGE